MIEERACREIQDLLALRVEDRTADEHHRVEAHLPGCGACRAVAAHDAEQERLLRALPPVSFTPAGRQRLRAKIERERGRGAIRTRLTSVGGTAAAVTALVALAFALYLLLSQNALPTAQVEVTRIVSERVEAARDQPPVVAAPAPPTPSPTAWLDRAGVKPPPATLEIGEQTQSAGVGSFCWSGPLEGEPRVAACADTVGLPTPLEPLRAHSPVNARFQLPVAESPKVLQLRAIPVGAADEIQRDDQWRWWSALHGADYELPKSGQPEVALELEPGLFVLQLSAWWEQQGDVVYGFLVEVEPSEVASMPTPNLTLPSDTIAWLRETLEGYEPGRAGDVAELLAAWLSEGNEPDDLEEMLRALRPLETVEPEVTVTDVNGDGWEDMAVETQWNGLPVVVCLGQQGGGYAGQPLPETFPGGHLAVIRGEISLQELNGEAGAETLVSYTLPGGSGSTELLYAYRWDEAGQPHLIFNAALITWASASSWELGVDGTQPGAQQIILTYPHLYADGFDHKLVNHPLARQVWRWDGALEQFVLAEEMVRGPEMSWGPQPRETPEDWLRWAVNEGEEAFRSGDYIAALDHYERALALAKAEDWTPEGEQADWGGYARFRRAEIMALTGYSADALTGMEAVVQDYQQDMLGELAAAFLSGYGGGMVSDAAARGVAALQNVDLYSHLYYERGGALRFPIQAGGVLYPGAGLAAYLDAHPELAGDPAGLLAGLQDTGFDATEADRAGDEILITLRLPDAPSADGASAVWRLARSGGPWRVVALEPDPATPGRLTEPGWPTVGGLSDPRYGPQWTDALPEEVPAEGQRIPSPAAGWVALLDETAGGLDLENPSGDITSVFPAGSTVASVSWSPDGRHLLAVRTHWLTAESGTGVQADGPAEIWDTRIVGDQAESARLLFQSELTGGVEGVIGPGQIVTGAWSPDSRYVTLWLGPLGASILADGLPLYVLDVETGTVTALGLTTLLHPGYQSWAPDGSTLAITAGSYRSAQVNKWLVFYDTGAGDMTTMITKSEQIPGILAWSPRGDLVAYAAVPARESGPEWADLLSFDNPAIAGRRIYLLDPATGTYWRLNEADTFQDAPVWSEDGKTLYYVQRERDRVLLMAADPDSGTAEPVPGAAYPLPQMPGFYGQGEWEELLKQR